MYRVAKLNKRLASFSKRGRVMNLADFASLSTAVSGVAVTASLIYLAIQTHHNTRNTRALIQQGATARTTAITVGLMDSDSCAAWIEGNGGAVTPEEIRKHQFFLHCMTAINAMEDHFLQHADGLLSREQFARNCENFRGLLSNPGLRAFWNARKPRMEQVAPKFSAFVDSLCTDDATEFRHIV
jgi:hypothetical protein